MADAAGASAAAPVADDSDDLILSGSGCYDDEDECANYAENGSGSDDLITPVYVPLKPTAHSPSKSSDSSSPQPNIKSNNIQRSCPPSTGSAEDDEDDEDDDDEDCGSGDSGIIGNDSGEATEKNGDYESLVVPSLSAATRSPIEDYDDRSILFTSQPIPPPAIDEPGSGFIEITTRRPTVLAKRPITGPTELVMLPLPSLPAVLAKGSAKKPSQHVPGLVNAPNQELLPGQSELDALDSQESLSEDLEKSPASPSVLPGTNQVQLNFSKRSADRTALLIAFVAVTLLLVLVLTPLLLLLRSRLVCNRSAAKLTQPGSNGKSFTSLVSAAGAVVPQVGPGGFGASGMGPLGTLSRCQTPMQLGYAPISNAALIGGSYSTANLASGCGPGGSVIGVDKAVKLPKKKDPREWYV